MVRRWSYLNTINHSFESRDALNVLVQVFQQTTFKATTYYRKPLYNPRITKLTRKNFYRRRHLNNWIVYQNIITLWAKEYLFFRKYSRTLLSIFFYKTSFLAYNCLIHLRLTTDELRSFGETRFTYFVKALSRFCRSVSIRTFLFVTQFRTFSPMLISSNIDFFNKNIGGSNVDVLYNLTPHYLFLVPDTFKTINVVNDIFALVFQKQLSYYLSFYKIFIYLNLSILLKVLFVLFLKNITYSSGASRNLKKITSNWLLKNKYKKLTWRNYSNGGRGAFGRTIVWTKASLRTRLITPSINYNYRYTWLSFVSTFYLTPFQNKLLALCFLATGGVLYVQSTTKFRLFSFITFPHLLKGIRKTTILPTFYTLLYVKLLSRVSLLELFPGSGIQYVRASGCFARFIKIDWYKHTAVLEMPSGVRKSFSLYALTSLGAVSLKIKKLIVNTKAGFWKRYGKKSKVRGVAMNPVDHPHGGRTKAIKHPRTPWGKTTKKK